MTTADIDVLARRFGVFLCVECGKCSAVCPMADLFDDYRYEVSPRGIMERALLGLDVGTGPDLWSCLTCDLCTRLCPQGVRVRDFIVAAREHALGAGGGGYAAFCRDCGLYLGPEHTETHLERLVGGAGDDLHRLCPRCRRHALAQRVHAT